MTATNSLPVKRTFPRPIHLLYILLLVIGCRLSYYWLSDGFSVSKISNTFPVVSEWQLPIPTEDEKRQLNVICEQKFRYLGKGSQVYAFESEDEKYVLKLFKCYHLQPVGWIGQIPLPGKIDAARKAALDKRQKKIADTLRSYKIASQSLRDECGLISMQILPTAEVNQEIILVDKLGREHAINLSKYGYIMQRKASLIYPKLSQWIAENDLFSAKKAISSTVALIVQRSRKGVQDSDPDLHKNAGLIETTAILIDLGSLHRTPEAASEEVYKRDLLKITNRLREWLQKQSPELATYLDQEIEHASRSKWKKPNYPDEKNGFFW